MTIGIPGGHFFLSPLHSLIVIPEFPHSFPLFLIVIPGLTGNLFQKSSKPFKKRKTFFQKKKNR
jgi:hypothetical protein